jgi:L-fucose isomerase-like protein
MSDASTPREGYGTTSGIASLTGSAAANLRFGFVTVTAAPLGDRSLAGAASGYARALESIGGEEWELSDVSDPAPLAVLVETGGTERTILDLWRRRLDTAAKAPVLLVAHSGGNSLPAALEAFARLRQDGMKGRVLFLGSPDSDAGLASIAEAVRDIDAWRQLRLARIGVIGSPSGWLVASSPDPLVVRETWGPLVLPVNLDQLIDAIRTAAGGAHGSGTESIDAGAAEVLEPGSGDVATAELAFAAVRHIAEQYGLTGVALRCFDLVSELGTTGCVALSRLADLGIVAGCEGDLMSTVAMLWAKLILDEVSWMANPAAVDVESGTLMLAHCTVPRSMVQGYSLRSHFESGKGVALEGALPNGPATLVRIGGKNMTELWLAEGEVVRQGTDENLCRTQAEVRLTDSTRAADLLERPLGNHVVLIRGHHSRRLRSWWEMMIAD